MSLFLLGGLSLFPSNGIHLQGDIMFVFVAAHVHQIILNFLKFVIFESTLSEVIVELLARVENHKDIEDNHGQTSHSLINWFHTLSGVRVKNIVDLNTYRGNKESNVDAHYLLFHREIAGVNEGDVHKACQVSFETY